VRVAKYLVILLVLIIGVAAESADTLRIENEYLAIEFDAERLSFAAISKASGLKFVERGRL
jgi:hypothetical protein